MRVGRSKIWSIGIIAAVLFLAACDKDKSTSSKESARVSFYMTDAPGDFEQVNIEVVGLTAITDSGQVEVPIDTGIYDLLDLTNGVDTLLGSISVGSGRLNQIRLLLGDNNQVKVDGEFFDLKTPSGQQSGLKVNVNQDLVGGLNYELLIDFDAAKSIVVTGNNKYILKPVLRVMLRGTETGIEGVVFDGVDSTHTEPVFAISSEQDTFSTFSTNEGTFAILGLTEGTYTVVAGTAPDTAQRTGVVVLEDNVTPVDTLLIE